MIIEIIVLVIFFIIITPILFKIEISFNVIRNNGTLKILLFRLLPIYFQHLQIDNGFIKLIKNPEKVKKIKLSFKKKDVQKFNNNFSLILNSQIVKKIDLNTKFGLKDSPFYVAMFSGIYNSAIGVFFSINNAKGNIIETQSKLKTYFKYNYLKVGISLNISLSIYQMISLIMQSKLGVK